MPCAIILGRDHAFVCLVIELHIHEFKCMIATCLCLCVCHVESLIVSNFCLSYMSYVNLTFSYSCYSKYLNIAWTLCLAWCMLHEIEFGQKFDGFILEDLYIILENHTHVMQGVYPNLASMVLLIRDFLRKIYVVPIYVDKITVPERQNHWSETTWDPWTCGLWFCESEKKKQTKLVWASSSLSQPSTSASRWCYTPARLTLLRVDGDTIDENSNDDESGEGASERGCKDDD